MSVMLYKHPAENKTKHNWFHGDNFDYIIVDESEVDAAKKAGWSLTTKEAKTPKKKPARSRRKKKDELD